LDELHSSLYGSAPKTIPCQRSFMRRDKVDLIRQLTR